jgi:hypothetical protein
MQVRVEPPRRNGGSPVYHFVDNVEYVSPANIGNVPMPPGRRGVLID